MFILGIVAFLITLLLPFFLASFIGKILGLYKSVDDRVLAGVCGGAGERFDVPAGFIRIVWLVSVLFFGVGFWWYIAFAIVLPTGRTHRRQHYRYEDDY